MPVTGWKRVDLYSFPKYALGDMHHMMMWFVFIFTFFHTMM